MSEKTDDKNRWERRKPVSPETRTTRPVARNGSVTEILNQTQGHLILRWDAWRNSKQIKELGLPAVYCLLAVFFLTFFATEAFFQHQTLHGQILLGFGLLTVGCFVYLRISGNSRTTITLIVFLMAILCLFLLITGGIHGTGPLWYFAFPPVALFIQRLWAGMISVVLLFAATLLVLTLQPFGFDPSAYSSAFIERLLAVYICVSVMSFLYAYARTSAELQLDDIRNSYQTMANTEELTGLANRRRMTDILYRQVSRALKNQTTFSIIIFDIDYFKNINDQYGHDAGDAVLRSIPEVLHKVLRTPDVCGRWGGEEFLVMLPETGLAGAIRVAERLRIGFEEYRSKHGENILSITVSIGVSEFRRAGSLEECIKRADKNLYAAKAAGRNCVITGS